MEDYMMLFSYLAFIALSALYLVIDPKLYRILRVSAGTEAPYPELVTEGELMLRVMFTVTLLFWAVLWGVKLSLLFVFRRLIIDLPRYMKAWWVVFIFTLLTFVGCAISNFTSCRNMKVWFTFGKSIFEAETLLD
jgi:hypothetical protein